MSTKTLLGVKLHNACTSIATGPRKVTVLLPHHSLTISESVVCKSFLLWSMPMPLWVCGVPNHSKDVQYLKGTPKWYAPLENSIHMEDQRFHPGWDKVVPESCLVCESRLQESSLENYPMLRNWNLPVLLTVWIGTSVSTTVLSPTCKTLLCTLLGHDKRHFAKADWLVRTCLQQGRALCKADNWQKQWP